MRFKRMCLAGLAAACLINSLPAAAAAPVEIRRTAYGIPHIKATSEQGLGYGIGYAYAEDNACLLANEILTVNGERARFFGQAQFAAPNVTNLQSDFFFRWLNRDELVQTFWDAQPADIRALLSGYAAGYNQYLRDAGKQGASSDCSGKPWLKEISEADLVKLMRRLLVHGGAWQFSRAILNAAPPPRAGKNAARMQDAAYAMEDWEGHTSTNGSNAIAIGKDLSANGSAILLGNPHFPWEGGLRFYQMQLTIPGKLNVMGAALPGLPVINIGFNKKIAWTHTLDASSHFSVYRLRIDPADASHYLVDGESVPMKKVPVSVDVLEQDGTLARKHHDFYESRYGLVMSLPGRFAWNSTEAYALRDTNLDNTRPLQQWYAMNRADSLAALKKTVVDLVGIPWATTIAADAKGETMFMNVSVIPGMDQDQIDACAVKNNGVPVSIYNGFPVLDGARRSCAWKNDLTAPQAGILSGDKLPVLVRSDYVQNSNDSAWLTQPAAPLTGFPITVSREKTELSPRARFANEWLQRTAETNPSAKEGSGITPDMLQGMLLSNEVYMAPRVLDDLLRLCLPEGTEPENRKAMEPLCQSLKNWDGTANLNAGAGYLYFAKIIERIRKTPRVWKHPFNPLEPMNTPRGLNIDNVDIADQLRKVMIDAATEANKEGVLPTMKWGEIQVAVSGTRSLPIHGGSGNAGVYNVIESVADTKGKRKVVSGSSYIQIVWFGRNGPRAKTLLTYSESSDTHSPNSIDQTALFSEKKWIDLPFSEVQIKKDASYRLEILHP